MPGPKIGDLLEAGEGLKMSVITPPSLIRGEEHLGGKHAFRSSLIVSVASSGYLASQQKRQRQNRKWKCHSQYGAVVLQYCHSQSIRREHCIVKKQVHSRNHGFHLGYDKAARPRWPWRPKLSAEIVIFELGLVNFYS